MRASRLLSALLLLQARGRMTAAELAAELEVSERTVYRDIDSLAASGVPVYAERGPAGGYRLLDGYRTRLTGLTGDEAESLFLAGIPGPAAELGLGGVLAAAERKVLAALPPQLRERAGAVRERFHLDAPSWFRDIERPEHLAAVADAVWEQRRIEVRYVRWGQQLVTRTLDPLGIVLKAGVWYVAAGVAGSTRTYRVERIRELAALDERFDRPPGFDLAAYWETWSQQFQQRLYPEEVVVRVSPKGRALIGPYLGTAASSRAEETAEAPDAQGWVVVRVPVESMARAAGQLLRFGLDAEVVEPVRLREELARLTAALAERYSRS